MATSSPMECGVCHEEFDDEERCPRILLCSHHLCTHCINCIITNGTRRCPFCRSDIDARCATDLMIIYGLLDVIKYVSAQNSTSNTSYQKEPTPRVKRIDDFKKETTESTQDLLARCEDMQRFVESSLQDMEEKKNNIQLQNDSIKNDIFVKFNEIVLSNEKYIQEFNGKQDTLLGPMDEIKEKKKQLEMLIENLNTVSTYKEAGSIVEDAEETIAATSEWAKTLKEFLCKEENTLQTTAKDIKTTKIMISITLEMLNSLEGTIGEVEHNPKNIVNAFKEILIGQISINTFRDMTEPVKNLVKQGRVFACQNQEGRTRSAQITLSNNKICLHHLKDGPLPRNVHVLEYRDVMSLLDPSSRLAFLELGDGELTLGRILIRVTPDTNGARNFALLCTGEMGPSYVNTMMLEVQSIGNEAEVLRGGDYEFGNGSGGKPIVLGLQEEVKSKYDRPWLAGAVWGYGDDKFSQYCINTRDIPGRTCHYTFGMVEEGLEIVRKAINHYTDITLLSVRDCGVVVPCSMPKD